VKLQLDDRKVPLPAADGEVKRIAIELATGETSRGMGPVVGSGDKSSNPRCSGGAAIVNAISVIGPGRM